MACQLMPSSVLRKTRLAQVYSTFGSCGEKTVGAVVLVSAPYEKQRERVLARPNMSPEKFEAILSRQVPDAEKRKRADIVIDTGVSLEETRKAVEEALLTIAAS